MPAQKSLADNYLEAIVNLSAVVGSPSFKNDRNRTVSKLEWGFYLKTTVVPLVKIFVISLP